jgi:hypothetical protein
MSVPVLRKFPSTVFYFWNTACNKTIGQLPVRQHRERCMAVPVLNLKAQYATIRSKIETAVHAVLESGSSSAPTSRRWKKS